MVDKVSADRLQQRPSGPAGGRAGKQGPGRHALGGQHAEADDIQSHVRQQREDDRQHDEDDGVMTVGIKAGQQRGDDDTNAEDAEEDHRAAEPLQVAGARRARQVPHLFHREQPRLGESASAPEQSEQPDHQAQHAGAAQLGHVTGQLVADQRKLPGDRIQHILAQRRVAGRDEAEDRHQDEQQREHRDERGVRKASGQGAAVVVAVLLDHPDHECGCPMTLLGPVRPPEGALHEVHRQHPLPVSSPHSRGSDAAVGPS
jgi:hypothetical protein